MWPDLEASIPILSFAAGRLLYRTRNHLGQGTALTAGLRSSRHLIRGSILYQAWSNLSSTRGTSVGALRMCLLSGRINILRV